jgi:NAD(P)-dependent dehydrogenase (short-subunit alcohol dehydrogenase family)
MRVSPIALVTGGNRGIGLEVCRQLAQNRMRVHLLAGELAGTGVLVNGVCPGWVATDMGAAVGGWCTTALRAWSGARRCPTTVRPGASSATVAPCHGDARRAISTR